LTLHQGSVFSFAIIPVLLSNDIWLSGAVPQYGKVVSIAGTKLVMTDTIGRSEHAYTPAGGQVPNLL
jgi:hypothetical protein